VNLDGVFRTAIAAMDSTTKSIQELVRIKPWVGEDLYGKVSYGATRKYRAVVDRTEREVRLQDGRTISITATVAFLVPVSSIGAVGRTEPIDVRDRIYLADDTTGPIVSLRGPKTPASATSRYFQQVMLG
jgi:hypothetical protein